MPAPGRRLERLADQIRSEVAAMIATELRDPRIGLVTVTRVELSGDLRHGRILISVLGNEEAQQQALEGLSSAAGYLRREVGRRLRLRHTLELSFILDRGVEQLQRIENLLQKLKSSDK